MKKWALLLSIPILFIVDRYFKILIMSRFYEGDSVEVFPGFFHLTRVNNTGVAFGLFRGYGNILLYLSAAGTIFLLLYLIYEFRQSKEISLKKTALALVIAGAFGNLYDRFCYGYVVDFLDFRFWPVFNIADISISIGLILLLAYLLNNYRTRPTT